MHRYRIAGAQRSEAEAQFPAAAKVNVNSIKTKPGLQGWASDKRDAAERERSGCGATGTADGGGTPPTEGGLPQAGGGHGGPPEAGGLIYNPVK